MKNKNANKTIVFTVILGSLFLLLGVLFLPKLPHSNMQSEIFWAKKVEQKSIYDMVIIGDSRVYRGVNPNLKDMKILAENGAFNYGFSSAGVDTFLIENGIKKLNPKGKKIVLLGISSSSFYKPNIENEHLKSLLQKDEKDQWVKRNIYPYLTCFERYSLLDFKNIYKKEFYYHTFLSESGWIESKKTPMDSTEALASYADFYTMHKNDNLGASKVIKYLEKLVKKGYTIYCFRMPTSHAMRQLEDKNSTLNFEELKLAFNKIGVRWLDIKKYYESYDGSHLDGENAIKLSTELTELMNNY